MVCEIGTALPEHALSLLRLQIEFPDFDIGPDQMPLRLNKMSGEANVSAEVFQHKENTPMFFCLDRLI
jgi:hypothetical protein